jgi:hypothetical protein
MKIIDFYGLIDINPNLDPLLGKKEDPIIDLEIYTGFLSFEE